MSDPTFKGFRRSDGRVGIRNHVLVLPTVVCANGVVERLDREAADLGLALVTHQHGCGQIGDDLTLTRRILAGVAASPNVGAVIVVTLGCESNQPEEIVAAAERAGKPVEVCSIQELGGVTATFERVREIAAEMIVAVTAVRREALPVSELIVGLECGGSDSWSGITANPALGWAADALVAAGGTVVLAETPEAIGGEQILAERAATSAVAEQLLTRVAAWEAAAASVGVDVRGAQPAVGNIAGGLSTIEEKSLGALRKGGTSPVTEIVDYGVAPTERGLVFMDTPGQDIEQVTGLAAGGAQLVCFTTGRGTPTGSPVLPVVKIASNSNTAQTFAEHIDIDAGPIASGGASVEEIGKQILETIVAVASGESTAAERGRHREFALPRLWGSL